MKELVFTMILSIAPFVSNAEKEVSTNTPQPITLQVKKIDPSSSTKPHGRSPIAIPDVCIDSHTLYFHTMQWISLLNILQNDVVVFSKTVPLGTTTVELPIELEGNCGIRLYTDAFVFEGEIEL